MAKTSNRAILIGEYIPNYQMFYDLGLDFKNQDFNSLLKSIANIKNEDEIINPGTASKHLFFSILCIVTSDEYIYLHKETLLALKLIKKEEFYIVLLSGSLFDWKISIDSCLSSNSKLNNLFSTIFQIFYKDLNFTQLWENKNIQSTDGKFRISDKRTTNRH